MIVQKAVDKVQKVAQKDVKGDKNEKKNDRNDRKFGGKKGLKGAPKKKQDDWQPVTKLGRLVKRKEIKSLDQIFKFSIPIKQSQIVDELLKDIKEQVMQVKPVQKQTQAGQRTRFKAYVVVGDGNKYLGLGWKCHKEVQGAIKGSILMAKTNIIPIRKGYWGNKIGEVHTVPYKVTGKSGSVKVRLIPAPRGSGIVCPPVSKKVLQFAGIQDVFSKTGGKTRTKGNFIKATYACLEKTYKYLSPDLWGKAQEQCHPFQVHEGLLNAKK